MEVSHSLDFIILNIYFIIEIKMKIFVCILLAATVTQAGILETKSRRQKASPRAPSKSCQDAIKVSGTGYVGFGVNGIYHKQEEKVSDRPLYVNKDDIAISFHELYGNWWITNKVNAGQNSGKFIV